MLTRSEGMLSQCEHFMLSIYSKRCSAKSISANGIFIHFNLRPLHYNFHSTQLYLTNDILECFKCSCKPTGMFYLWHLTLQRVIFFVYLFSWTIQQHSCKVIRPLGYERVYLPRFKVAKTPFHIQGECMFYISQKNIVLSSSDICHGYFSARSICFFYLAVTVLLAL